MKLDLNKLKELGAFVGPPVERTVRWEQILDDGERVQNEGSVYVRRNSCATFEQDIKAHVSGKEASATKIASNICDEKGKAIVTYDQALDLSENLTAALLAAIFEVNSPKNSNPPTNSGTN